MEVYVSKSYIAFHSGSQSGIQTHEKAMKWAQDQMTGGRVDKVHIAQIIEVVERSTPPITVSRFEPEPAVLKEETEITLGDIPARKYA